MTADSHVLRGQLCPASFIAHLLVVGKNFFKSRVCLPMNWPTSRTIVHAFYRCAFKGFDASTMINIDAGSANN
jgi:hypothetical protein